mmetsp:Transcript_61892/g.151290  ORF Transcript_61892/g.151290 Transcript_61892/m.151290 type:complete len:515 (-) Transcript_61892:88-1632(-)
MGNNNNNNNRFGVGQFRLLICWMVFVESVRAVDASTQYLARAQCLPYQMPVVLLYRDPVTFNFTVVERLGIGIGMEDLLSSSSSSSTTTMTNITIQNNTTEIGAATPDQFRFLEASDYDADEIRPPALQIAKYDGTQARNRQKNYDEIVHDLYQNQRRVSGKPYRSLVASSSTISNNATTDNDHNNSSSNFFYARECGCFAPRNPVVYCPFVIESCLINIQEGAFPGCLNVKSEAAFGYTFNMVAIVWFAILALCLVLPFGTGAHFRDYIVSFCYRKWPEVIVDRIIDDHPDRARDLVRSQFRRQAQIERSTNRTQAANEVNASGRNELEETGHERDGGLAGIELQTFGTGRNDPIGIRRRPTSLVLKVRTYHPSLDQSHKQDVGSKNNPIDEEMGRRHIIIECTICFCRLRDGDRVGELCCKHVFHVSCLKQWLKRKNTCPLCQCKEIAEPRYHEEDIIDNHDTTTSNNNEGRNEDSLLPSSSDDIHHSTPPTETSSTMSSEAATTVGTSHDR